LRHQGEDFLVAAEIFLLNGGAAVVQARFEGGDDLRPGVESGKIPAISQAVDIEGV
jgi:hypothetical protein